jgi:serine/threonine protein kinase
MDSDNDLTIPVDTTRADDWTGDGPPLAPRNYAKGKVVAEGGMGAIRSVTDNNILRGVAMKTMKGSYTAEQALRFIHEAQITGQLQHPSIVPLYELGRDEDGNPFYTMKFVDGPTLADVINDIRTGKQAVIDEYPLSRLLEIFQRACDAMAFAHSRNVIHRDLKPENIMLGAFGEVLVLDWGLAKVLDDQDEDADGEKPTWIETDIETVKNSVQGESFKTMDGTVMGTPSFMAPEQAFGKKLDARADIYALGGILYNLLTLHLPVEGNNLQQVLIKVSRGEIRHPSEFNAESSRISKMTGQELVKADLTALRHCPAGQIPESLVAVTMKALAFEVDDRYDDVQALQADIRAYQSGFATGAEDAGLMRQLGLLVQRHKGAFGGVAAALLIIAGVILVAFRNVQQEKAAALAEKAKAEAAVSRMEEAEAAKKAQGKETAPTFAAAAEHQILTEQWAMAEVSANMAFTLDPELANGWLQRGRLLVASGDVIAAEGVFRKAKEKAAKGTETHRMAGHYLMVCIKYKVLAERHGKLANSDLYNLATRLEKAGDRAMAAKLLAKLGKGDEALRLRLDAAVNALKEANPGFTPSTIQLSGGQVEFITQGNQTSNRLVDISALRGLPLTHVNLHGAPVADISPLRGMPLQQLALLNTNVTDLSPLRGIPLRRLVIKFSYVRESGHYASTIRDISPLAQMPLDYLYITGCDFKDLRPLKGMRLTFLQIDGNEQLTNIDALKGMPLTRLSLYARKVTDFSALRGLPLTTLYLTGGHLSDLTPLRGMPLKELRLTGATYTSLEPLSGLPLQRLILQGALCTDLTPLSKLPLRTLSMSIAPSPDLAERELDVSCLASLTHLNSLEISAPIVRLKGVDALREHPALKVLDIRTEIASLRSKKPVAQFWKEYDAKTRAKGETAAGKAQGAPQQN